VLGVFLLALSQDVQPLESVVNESHDHRDHDNCDDPAEHCLNKPETGTEDQENLLTCKSHEIRKAETRS